jgi:hypothetical protein
MANWSNPTLTSTYTNFLSELKDRDDDLAKAFDGTTSSNLATGTIRWNSTANRWQKWTGSVWAELTATYALTALTTTGNAGIGGTLAVTGATTLAAATATTPATDNNSTAVATTAYVRAQAYAPLASPALTGTPTVPTAAVGTNSTQAASTAFVLANSLLKTGGTMTGTLAITGVSRLLVRTSTAIEVESGFSDVVQQIVGGDPFAVFRYDASGSSSVTSWFCRSRNAAVGEHTILQANDGISRFNFQGSDGAKFVTAARFEAAVDGTPGANDMPGRLVFSTTADGASSPTEAMRLTSDKYLRMAAGTSGIQFGGDTAAANALNDYEEGTFTPTVIGLGTAGTGTYQVQVGRYTKIGDVVRFSLIVKWNAHTGTGNMRLAGLPFTALNIDDSGACFSILPTDLTFSNNIAAIGAQNSTQVNLTTYSSNATNVALPIDTTGLIRVSGVYEVA